MQHRRNRIITSIAAIAAVVSLLCCFAPSLGRAETRAPAVKQGALFKVHSAGHTVYLFGTIHVGKPEFFPFEPGLIAALDASSALALEIDPLSETGALQETVQKHGYYPEGASSRTDIPPALQIRLEKALQRGGLEYAALAQRKPWMLATVLTLMQFSTQGYESRLASEVVLSELARKKRKPIIELESAESQLQLFSKLPMPEQLRFLEDTVAAIEDEEQAREVMEIVKVWRQADKTGLEALAKRLADDKTFSGIFFRRVLLEGRNPGLATGIADMLKREKTSFAAIGILHLIGTGSVPALLQQRGYRVERMY